jgi:hypothetical protein
MKKQDIEIQQIAKPQHGVISWRQLQDLRVTRSQIKRRVRSGEWVRELPGVWRLSWSEPTWMQRVWGASLWGGTEALISHRAAARLWELDGVKFEAIELTVAHRLRTEVQWLSPHQRDAMPREMRRMRNGVPVTSPARTLVDLAGVVDEETLEQALEHALRRRIVSVPAIRRALGLFPARGRAGTGRVARLLESDIWHPETQSELERQALGLFRRFRLPRPQCQYDVIEENRRLAVVDFAWPRVKVIVEAEGFQFHSGREAWESDIARYNALAVHGWTVLRLTHSDLQGGAEAFASSVGRAIAARGPRHRARQFAH